MPKIPKAAPKVTQSVKEMREAVAADVKSQKMGRAVATNVNDIIAKKGGMLKPKKTNFDKMDKQANK